MKRLLAAVAVALAFIAIAPAAAGAADGVPRLGHVFLIVGENTSASQITPAHAPYLTGGLKPRSAWLTRYSAFNSSSLGQYIGMLSGQFTRCEKNNALPLHCHQNVDNLYQQLDRRGRPWIQWNESMDNSCDIFDHGSAWARNIYSAHHNPALYFTGIEGGRYDEAFAPSLECRTRDVSMGSTGPNDTGAFDSALAAGRVGDFNLVVPNDCENGHDPCGGSRDPVRQFDALLAREVPKIEASPAFGPNDVIAITWDEGADPPLDHRHVLLALTGGPVKPGVYRGGPLDHYSLLRALESGFGLRHLRNAAKVRPIVGVWR